MYNANLISGIDGENVPKMAIIYQENPIADVALVNGVICQDGAQRWDQDCRIILWIINNDRQVYDKILSCPGASPFGERQATLLHA